jgi:hypothetical protein
MDQETLNSYSLFDTVCVDYLPVCTAGAEFESAARTTTSDRLCKTLTAACTLNVQYESVAPTTTSNRYCSDVLECSSATQYETNAPTSTKDRTCAFATTCTTDVQYASSKLTALSDRVCADVSQCTSTEYERIAPTSTSDRECSIIADPDSFSIIRPFWNGDAQDLVDSFARWTDFLPCNLDSDGNPVNPNLPISMQLYYARDIDAEDADTLAMRNIIDAVLVDDGAEWRKCFRDIELIGAGLTHEQDQYHSDQFDPTWNLGPNMQFYRLIQSKAGVGTFYYMEGDSTPIASFWLDSLSGEIEASRPFSVLGGKYGGHNWNAYPGDTIIKPPLRNHLNGNGVYDVSHTLIQDLVSMFTDDDAWASEHHASFDVAFTELLIDQNGVAVVDLAESPSNYKTSSLLTNFATTMTLPQDISTTATIVHGAVRCPLFL